MKLLVEGFGTNIPKFLAYFQGKSIGDLLDITDDVFTSCLEISLKGLQLPNGFSWGLLDVNLNVED